MAAYFAGSAPPSQNAWASSSFQSSQASTPGTFEANPRIAWAKVSGSVGGLVPPLPPDAHPAGAQVLRRRGGRLGLLHGLDDAGVESVRRGREAAREHDGENSGEAE